MKLKTLAQIMLVSCSLVGLVACSSLSKRSDDASVTDVDGGPGGAQTTGLGDDDGFGGDSNMSPEQLLAKHVFYFDFDSSELHGNERAAVLANADYVAGHSASKILLEGHTDPRGSREYNVALGERRANAVASLMRSKGVNASQIRVISYGAERLAVTGRDDADYQKDRRAVLVYLQK